MSTFQIFLIRFFNNFWENICKMANSKSKMPVGVYQNIILSNYLSTNIFHVQKKWKDIIKFKEEWTERENAFAENNLFYSLLQWLEIR